MHMRSGSIQSRSPMTSKFSWFASNSTVWLLILLSFCNASTLDNPLCFQERPYRGKVIRDGESSEEIFRKYQAKLEEYRDVAFSSKLDWNILKRTKDGMEVATFSKEGDRDCPYVRMRATMPTSAQSLYNFMSFANWKTFMPIINPFYEGMSIIDEITFGDKTLVITRKHSKSIFGFGRRDFSLLAVTSNTDPQHSGALISGTISVIAPQLIPRYKGFTRAFQDMVCFYKPAGRCADGNDQTELTIILRTDLNDSADDGTGGSVPMWLVVKTLGLAGSKALQSLHQVVRKHALP